MGNDFGPVTEPVVAGPPERPNKLARVLATTVVSSLAAVIVTRLLGRRAGVIAVLLTASAHEVIEAPLARFFGKHLRQMTT